MKKEIKVPDISENVEKGTIAAVLVSKGDKVSVDQPLVEIETEKASTDIPSLYDGIVDEIKVAEGDEVTVNQVIMIIETEEDEARSEDKKEDQEDKGGNLDADEDQDNNKGKEKSENKEDRKHSDNKKEDEGDEKNPDKKHEDVKKDETNEEVQKEKQTQPKRNLSEVPAAPSVRRIAREMGVDLTEVKGSGPGGRVTADDVKSHTGKTKEDKKEDKTGEEDTLPDFSQWGSVSREKATTIRRLTAQNILTSWQTIPHVTNFDEADITDLENFRKKYQQKIKEEGTKLTVTALLLKITGFALQKFPKFNASLDKNEIILKHYYNIGVAVDTPRGLLVPVIRDVNSKSLVQISVELDELAQKARDKKISPDEMQGGNITISNLGGIGGTAFTPIILPPQVAILGVSRAVYKPVYINDELEKRMMVPLSVSYDHRIIDGADGARFLRWICNVIEDPYAILL